MKTTGKELLGMWNGENDELSWKHVDLEVLENGSLENGSCVEMITEVAGTGEVARLTVQQ